MRILRYTQVCCLYKIFCLGAHSDAEAHVSTESPPPRENSRLPGPHEEQSRAGCVVAPPRQGAQARLGKRGLSRLDQASRVCLVPACQNSEIPLRLRGRSRTPLCAVSTWPKFQAFLRDNRDSRCPMPADLPADPAKPTHRRRRIHDCANTRIISACIARVDGNRFH